MVHGYYHVNGQPLVNLGCMLGADAYRVRQSDLHREQAGGNAAKALLGKQHLQWNDPAAGPQQRGRGGTSGEPGVDPTTIAGVRSSHRSQKTNTAAFFPVGDEIGARPLVRPSRQHWQEHGGNAVKTLLGNEHLLWSTAGPPSMPSGGPSHAAEKKEGKAFAGKIVGEHRLHQLQNMCNEYLLGQQQHGQQQHVTRLPPLAHRSGGYAPPGPQTASHAALPALALPPQAPWQPLQQPFSARAPLDNGGDSPGCRFVRFGPAAGRQVHVWAPPPPACPPPACVAAHSGNAMGQKPR
jgi:hypothetical protein